MERNQHTTQNKALVRCAVTCPVCGEDSEQFRPNSRLFWHADHDIDLQPIGYQCKSGLEAFRPQLHHMWHCPSCRFSAPHTHFSDPLKRAMIQPQIVTGRLRELAVAGGGYQQVTQLLVARVSDTPHGYLREISLTLLAIFQRDVIEDMLGQGLLVPAGYAMRLAWLHRELAERSDETTQTLPLLQALYESLLPCWAGVPRNEEEALKLALKYHADSLQISAFTRHEANEIMALLMMGRICIKLDRFDAAREHLVMALQEIRDARDANKAALNSSTGSAVDAEAISTLSQREHRLRKVLHECESLVEIVHERYIKSQNTRAQSLLVLHRDAPQEALRQLLSEAGIPTAVVDRYAPPPKKGGFLSRIKG
jgi:uncharacterized protein (DUF2225 family)